MAISISILIVFVGLISLFTLPIEQYPDIAPPTVSVNASYTGASAEAVQKAVVMPLEESINGVENMTYMTSSSSNAGSASISIFFKQGTNPDMAAVNVQNRVSKAQGLLPQEVTKIGVFTQKRQTSFLQINSLISSDDTYDEDFIANYLDINVVPQLKRIQGVGDCMELGGTYSMRIWMKPDIMAQYGLVPSDITMALGEQNLEAPAGYLGEQSDNTNQFTMKYTGRLQDLEQYENIVIKTTADGNILKLKDIADVELGAVSYAYHGTCDGHPGITFMLFQVAGANATEVNEAISNKLDELSADLPAGLRFVKMMSSNDFLYASIANVEETLWIAILLVVLVVYFFLQDFRATIIPAISIIVSLIGTFACLSIAGFTINILTLFALVLAIGTVVDDAIVVVEAVQAKFDAGYTSSYKATKDAMADVTMAVISCTFVFMAVFIPVTFMGGTSGVFYTQFGVTMATSVGISCISALTLCPALCAMMMRPAKDGRRKGFFGAINYTTKKVYNKTMDVTMRGYMKLIRGMMAVRWVSFALIILAFLGLYFFATHTKTSLVPQEDQGVLMVNVSCAPGSSLAETGRVMDKIQPIFSNNEDVADFNRVTGYGLISGQGTSYGMFIVRLKNWKERKESWAEWGKRQIAKFMGYSLPPFHSANSIMSSCYLQLMDINEASVLVIQPGMIPGYGTGNSIDLNLQDKTGGDLHTFYNYSQDFSKKLSARPEVNMAYSTFSLNYPQYEVSIDAAKCKRAGLSPSTVLSALGSYCGGSYVSNMNQFGKVYRVMIEAPAKYRLSESDLSNMYVKNGMDMAPLSQFITLKQVLGPEVVTRFNLFSSISYNISPANGYSTGEVMNAIKEVAAETLPQGYGYEYGGISREEEQTMGSMDTYFIYGVAVILIFLILSCLYESFMVPWAVILSVPFGLMGSYMFAYFFGLENNIYLQTGVIMLIGLLAKTAILITEFALERRRKGMGLIEAAFAAAEARLRPILMTVLTMVFGMLPLMFATGAGANGNSSLGTGVVGGMVVGTIALLLLVPCLFVFFEYLQEKIRPVLKEEADQQFQMELERSRRQKEEAESEEPKL